MRIHVIFFTGQSGSFSINSQYYLDLEFVLDQVDPVVESFITILYEDELRVDPEVGRGKVKEQQTCFIENKDG